MALYKKHRALSEKTTSIEDPIEVVQRGVISFVPASGTTFLIPTRVQNVVKLSITPLTSTSAKSLANGWYSDYIPHYASDPGYVGFTGASAVTASEIGERVAINDSKIYVAKSALSAASYASSFTGASLDRYWTLLEEYPTDLKNYIEVNIEATASANFKTKKQRISFEVVGYEF